MSTLETILAQHAFRDPQMYGFPAACWCGEWVASERTADDDHAAHVADAIREWLTNDHTSLAALLAERSRLGERYEATSAARQSLTALTFELDRNAREIADHPQRAAITAALTNQGDQ